MAKNSKQDLFPTTKDAAEGPVECLGMTFANDEARRAYFTEKLREKLKDPEFRKIEGFPIGEDEDILAMSDPPYYTACPNPFIEDFVARIQAARSDDGGFHCEPFAIDVNEGKTDQLYRAHAYHTKVPHLAIVPSILNYTRPGDLVLDGFCGSGMTGVAAQWCGTAPLTYRRQVDADFESQHRKSPSWGGRFVILADLSPAASFIAASFNLPFQTSGFAEAATRLLKEVKEELGWMYETRHSNGKLGIINYTVWSEVFACPNCAKEIVFVEEALNPDTKRVESNVTCPSCGGDYTKEQLDLLFESQPSLNGIAVRKHPKRVPAIINYTFGGKVFEKKPDEHDLEVLRKVAQQSVPACLPTTRFPDCQMLRVGRMRTTNVEFVDDLFLRRPAIALATMWEKVTSHQDGQIRRNLLFFVEQAIWGMSVLNRYKTIMHGKTSSSNVNQYLSGVYYVPSQHSEVSPWYNLENRLRRLTKNAFARDYTSKGMALISTGACSSLGVPDNSVDYIFTDPPFGENIYYSDLNYLVESWHRVFTNSVPEAIVDRVREKGVLDYQRLMQGCFEEYYRVLKPGRWMTVVFHNSQNAVWNAIQEALQHAGFVVADVRTLDKKQGSFQQVVSGNTVKRDLIISAYKPNGGLEERFQKKAGTEDGVWDFVATHLRQLPVFVAKDGKAEPITERQSYLLFDRMVAFHVQRGYPIPVSSPEFHAGLRQRFPERDGMYFLPEQVSEYDRRRLEVKGIEQLQLFVSDEKSAIQWVRSQLSQEPRSFKELQPIYMKEAQKVWEKHEQPLELRTILEQNFVEDSEGLWHVPDPKNEAHLEQIRHRALMKEFQQYLDTKGKLKIVRTEALRAGFKECWQKKDYTTIVQMAKRVPDAVIQEDQALLMYFDNASLMLGE
jgi:hypothetical protein